MALNPFTYSLHIVIQSYRHRQPLSTRPAAKPNHEVNSLVPNWILSSNFPYWTTFASRVIGQYWVGSGSFQAIGSGRVHCIASVRVFFWYGSGRVSSSGSGRVAVFLPVHAPSPISFLIFHLLRSDPLPSPCSSRSLPFLSRSDLVSIILPIRSDPLVHSNSK